MMNKRYLRRTDYILIAATAAIIIMSLVIIGSATHINTPSEERYWFVQRQGIFALVNVAMAAFLMNFDYKVLQGYGNKLYVFNLILLVAVMLVGQSALGAQRWITIGPISIQPSEFSKLIMIISIATMLDDKIGHLNTIRDLVPVAAYVGVTFLLLLYLIVLWRGVVTARDAGDTFGRLLATGITSMLAFHVLVNVGMTMGIMPVTGIPLPLMSYGVSSLTTNIMSIAILLNIERRKQKLVF